MKTLLKFTIALIVAISTTACGDQTVGDDIKPLPYYESNERWVTSTAMYMNPVVFSPVSKVMLFERFRQSLPLECVKSHDLFKRYGKIVDAMDTYISIDVMESYIGEMEHYCPHMPKFKALPGSKNVVHEFVAM